MGEPTIRLHGIVGEAPNTAAIIGATLTATPGPVVIEVNSPGGDVFEACAIAAAIEAHGDVTAHGVGIVASAATLLTAVASRSALHHAAQFMVHDPSSVAWGTAAELRRHADDLEKTANHIACSYSKYTGHPVSRIRGWMRDETWLDPEEALALNFIDEILEAPVRGKPVAQFDYTRFQNAPKKLLALTARQGWAMQAPIEGAA